MNVAPDIGCPGCGYSLRGLAGPFVTCPECGATCDVDEIARLRLGSCTSARYVKLTFAAVFFVPAVAMLLLAAGLITVLSVAAPWTLLLGLGVLAYWAGLTRSALRRWTFPEACRMAVRVQAVVLLRLVSAALLSASLMGLLLSVMFVGLLERDAASAIGVFFTSLLFVPVACRGLHAAGCLDRRLGGRFAKREIELLAAG